MRSDSNRATLDVFHFFAPQGRHRHGAVHAYDLHLSAHVRTFFAAKTSKPIRRMPILPLISEKREASRRALRTSKNLIFSAWSTSRQSDVLPCSERSGHPAPNGAESMSGLSVDLPGLGPTMPGKQALQRSRMIGGPSERFSRTCAFPTVSRTPEPCPTPGSSQSGAIATIPSLKADAIIEPADGRWAAFETRVIEEDAPAAVSNPKRSHAKPCGNPKAHVRESELTAAIAGPFHARKADGGICSVPVRDAVPVDPALMRPHERAYGVFSPGISRQIVAAIRVHRSRITFEKAVAVAIDERRVDG